MCPVSQGLAERSDHVEDFFVAMARRGVAWVERARKSASRNKLDDQPFVSLTLAAAQRAFCVVAERELR
ncbi:hypothetical protein AC244_30650 [Ensifer adhaerens]|uniref:Uncharacterized protein n=1 Tax=Ensifer adhaerens TaxID=106592 RepID=A0A0L8BG88_ENSAD|nr:hypothetical protein AC244_30650 [Ensifer adhaerens]